MKNKIYLGNNIDVLKKFPDNYFDSVVTDPPYGLGDEPNAVEVLSDWVEKGYHEISGKGFMGKEWDVFVPQPLFWKEIYRVLKPGGYVLSFAGTRTYDWMVMAVRLAGFEIRDMIAWLYGSGFPKSHDISKAIDKSMGAEREVVGERADFVARRPKNKFEQFTSINKSEKGINSKKFAENMGIITAPATEEAKEWQGWGTALKPALEPIVMARKPLDGTVAQNVLKHGVGGINIDECRVGDEPFEITDGNYDNGNNVAFGNIKRTPKTYNGRFPANIIHDGSDEVVSLFPSEAGGGSGTYDFTKTSQENTTNIVTNIKSGHHFGDSGSASRFFYVAKASQWERNFGLEHLDKQVITDGRDKSIDNPYNRGETLRQNIHPTVKPIELMRYLVKLVTPKGGVVLDPFVGSGTTTIACKLEKFDYVGIELMPEYVEIANARLKAHNVVQYTIFDFMGDGDDS